MVDHVVKFTIWSAPLKLTFEEKRISTTNGGDLRRIGVSIWSTLESCNGKRNQYYLFIPFVVSICVV